MDIALAWNPEQQKGDFSLMGADLAPEEGLQTAIVVSLFTDRRADKDDLPANSPDDRRGWWGDAFADIPGDRIGSKLWLLAREKTEASALSRAREYAEEALAWLVEDGVVERVEVTAERVKDSILGLGVVCHRPQSAPRKYRFQAFWGRHAV